MAPKQGSRAYLRFDSPSRGRVLEPGIIGEVGDSSWTLVFENRHHAVETGGERLIYFSRARGFFQQPVRIEAQSSEGPPFSLTLKPIGEPVDADTRLEDRVAAADYGLEATLGDEPNCPIHDVSLSGLAVISRRAHQIGQPLEVAIHYGEKEYVGEVEIQAASALSDGRTRYGLLGVFDTPQGQNLKNALTKMTLEIQQQQLARLSESS